MIRKPKTWTLWIVAVSINLVPLVAYGDACDPTLMSCLPEAMMSKAPDAPAKPAPKKARAKPRARPAAKPVVAAAPETRLTMEDLLKAQMSGIKLNLDAPVAAAPRDTSEWPDLSLADARNTFISFEAPKVGRGDASARLLGMVFAECADKFSIEKAPSAMCGSAPTFRIKAQSDAVACMDNLKKSKKDCGNTQCVDLSEIGGRLDLANGPEGQLQMLHVDPNLNESRRNVCESLGASYWTDATFAAREADRRELLNQSRIMSAKQQVASCVRNVEELEAARTSCQLLVSLDAAKSVDECMAAHHSPEEELKILARQAGTEKVESLERVRRDVVKWANRNDAGCGKAIAAIQKIAQRQASAKPERRSRRDRDAEDFDPIAGYDAALETIESSMDESECLGDSYKLADMAYNLQVNRLAAIGQNYGRNNQEYYSSMQSLAEELQEDYEYTCGGGYGSYPQMDPECASLTQLIQKTQYQSLPQIEQASYAVDLRNYQSAMAFQQAQMYGMQPNASSMGGMFGARGGAQASYGGSYGFGMY